MATELITAANLREIFAIKQDIDDTQLTRPILAASRRLRVWVGDTAYDDAIAASPTDLIRKAALVYAEAHLAMHFAVLGLNTMLRQEGLVNTERTESDTIITFLKPDEVSKMQRAYMEMAEELAREYMTSDGTPGSPFVVTDEC